MQFCYRCPCYNYNYYHSIKRAGRFLGVAYISILLYQICLHLISNNRIHSYCTRRHRPTMRHVFAFCVLNLQVSMRAKSALSDVMDGISSHPRHSESFYLGTPVCLIKVHRNDVTLTRAHLLELKTVRGPQRYTAGRLTQKPMDCISSVTCWSAIRFWNLRAT